MVQISGLADSWPSLLSGYDFWFEQGRCKEMFGIGTPLAVYAIYWVLKMSSPQWRGKFSFHRLHFVGMHKLDLDGWVDAMEGFESPCRGTGQSSVVVGFKWNILVPCFRPFALIAWKTITSLVTQITWKEQFMERDKNDVSSKSLT